MVVWNLVPISRKGVPDFRIDGLWLPVTVYKGSEVKSLRKHEKNFSKLMLKLMKDEDLLEKSWASDSLNQYKNSQN